MELCWLEVLIGKSASTWYLDHHSGVVQALVAGIAGLCQLCVGHGKLLGTARFDCPSKDIERRLGDGRSDVGSTEGVILGNGAGDARERIAQFFEFIGGIA